jgi:hypothetical protein
MIKIRSFKNISEPTLIGFEATLTTPQADYEFSSTGPIVDPTSPFDGGLFGGITWPRSRFQIRPNLVLEQQMFVSQDTPDIAISWELRGELVPVSLTVRPYFVTCAPRGYRDIGFHFDPEEEGGRLVWLPSVCRSKIIADTNGRYSDEPVRFAEAIVQTNPNAESLVAPGRFEFDLNHHHPSVLIFSSEGGARTQTQQFVGMFLASLMRPALDGIEFKPAQAAESLIAA